ncbi:porin [Pseudoduganella namucuonensis]|uniref:Outer membrane protein (Porin) n=1 Tax=Pseudoduganella namucuonensis TaxID=1035707 RepID=A0A1I7M3V7_9BURK|nr:porin [Pseudoduganella namucuonensis]SFV16500.1 Outer membrane protein (porin) [Pseudoduganella namucuonensis]
MNKQVSAACLLAAAWSAASFAHAQNNVTLYGTIDEYIGYIRSGTGNDITGLNDGAILRSRLGVRGTEELGQGYQLKFTLEQGIGADTGAAADGSRLFDRQAWIGLNTPVGEFRMGRQNTQVFYIGGAIDYTERTTFGSIFNTFGVPSRYDNDLSWKSPRVAGLQMDLHYALPENTAATSNKGIWQLALDYQSGPWRAGYAGLVASPNAATATVRERIHYHNLYLNYKYGPGTVYLAAGRSNNSTANGNGRNTGAILSLVGSPNNHFAGTDLNAGRYYNLWEFSADYRVSPALKVGAMLGGVRDTTGGEAGARSANAGAYYDLSKRTLLYGFASVMKNQANAGFRFSGSAAPSANLANADVNGQRLAGLQLGILHRF